MPGGEDYIQGITICNSLVFFRNCNHFIVTGLNDIYLDVQLQTELARQAGTRSCKACMPR